MKIFVRLFFLLLSSTALAEAPDFDAATLAVKKLLFTMVEADTTNPPGNEERIVKIVAARLKKENIHFNTMEFERGRQNIVARLKGDGRKKPLLLLAHIDVVGTKDQEWSIPNPHQVAERDGYYIGRGVSDDLGMAAVATEVFILLKKSAALLQRDVILALTGDEEAGGDGTQYLLKTHPELADAEIALNEGGGLVLDNSGKLKFASVQLAEKVYQDYRLTAKGQTGHSSVPQTDNAIYKLARALARIEKHRFPIRLIPVTREYLKERAQLEPQPLAVAMKKLALAKNAKADASTLKQIEENMSLATLLRTTCVATLVQGGSKENALPAMATANINCRILPDETSEDVRKELARVISDSEIKIESVAAAKPSPASPTQGVVMEAIKKTVEQMWPGVPVIANMGRGATDSKYLRQQGIAAYGLVPIANSEADAKRAHGVDERIPVASLRPGVEFFYKLISELAY